MKILNRVTNNIDDKKTAIEFTGKEVAILISLLRNNTATDATRNIEASSFIPFSELNNKRVTGDEYSDLSEGMQEAFEALL